VSTLNSITENWKKHTTYIVHAQPGPKEVKNFTNYKQIYLIYMKKPQLGSSSRRGYIWKCQELDSISMEQASSITMDE
jgi:hypothetical protein